MSRYVKWVREFWGNFLWFQKKIHEKYSRTKCFLISIHFFWCVLTDGCSPEEYLWFEFYHKNRKERKTFLTYVRHARMQKQYNNAKVRKILNDKCEFNNFFSSAIGREWMDADEASEEEIEDFLNVHKTVMVKPKMGGQGKGVYQYTEGGYGENCPVVYWRNVLYNTLLCRNSIQILLILCV